MLEWPNPRLGLLPLPPVLFTFPHVRTFFHGRSIFCTRVTEKIVRIVAERGL